MPKFCIFNDRFSSNVGDGVIADCLEYGLRHRVPHATFQTIDLGCRTGYAPDSKARYRSAGGRLRHAWYNAPSFAHRALSYYRVDHRFRAYVSDRSAGADGFILGGGQLITGNGTFFPHRLATIAAIARARRIPLFIHGVGVSDPRGWQPDAAEFLQRAFGGAQTLVSVAPRDRLSAEHWASAFGGPAPGLARDPALLAAEVYSSAARAGRKLARSNVGIGVISANVVNWFGGKPGSTVKPSLDFFVDAGLGLIRNRRTPVYFTNGSGEDEAVLEALAELIAHHYPDLHRQAHFKRRPETAAELVEIIAGLDGLIAHRMHANIVAYALRIPHVGLGWDQKLASFFESVGRARYLLGAGGTGADAVHMIAEAMEEGIAPYEHDAVTGDAWDGIEMLADQLRHVGRTAKVA